MENAADEGDPPQHWRLDPDKDLILSDLHLGVDRSDAGDLQTSALRFNWRAPLQMSTEPQPAAVVLATPGGRQHQDADRDTETAVTADKNRHDAVASRSCVISHEQEERHALSVDTFACDADGDLILTRRRRSAALEDAMLSLEIRHRMATPLRDVGMQVWRGSLLLAEYVLSRASEFAGAVSCELGAGTGVAGIALACAGARRVFVTDVGPRVLDLCQANVLANEAWYPCGPSTALVRWLDWDEAPPALEDGAASGQGRDGSEPSIFYAWRPSELHELQHAEVRLEQLHVPTLLVEVILAADTVYDEVLTEAFMRCAARMLQPCQACGDALPPSAGRRLLVALEKRYNFTLRDLDARAVAYQHWRSVFAADLPASGSERGPADVHGRMPLQGRQIPLSDVPCLLEYERGRDLELWELVLERS